MNEYIKVMKAMSDPGRVRILKLLETEELCVCEINAALGLAQPTVSKHMKQLEDAGLVSRRRKGSWNMFSLNTTPDNPFVEPLLNLLRGWLNDDPAVTQLLDSLPKIYQQTRSRAS